MTTRWCRFMPAFAIAAAAACGETHDRGAIQPGNDAGAGNGSDGPGSSGGGGGGGGDSAHNKPGLILLQMSTDIAAGAVFAAAPIAGCTISQIGPCAVRRCDQPPDEPGPLATAGRITISDGRASFTMDPDDDRSYGYAPPAGEEVRFPSGATVSAAAAGGDVPAFHGVTAMLADELIADDDYSVIDRTADLVVGWTGGGPAGAVVFFTETDDATTTGELSCSFAPTAGTGTIPAAAFQAVPRCADDSTICLWSLTPETTTHFVDGDFAIDFTVRAGGAAGEWLTATSPPLR